MLVQLDSTTEDHLPTSRDTPSITTEIPPNTLNTSENTLKTPNNPEHKPETIALKIKTTDSKSDTTEITNTSDNASKQNKELATNKMRDQTIGPLSNHLNAMKTTQPHTLHNTKTYTILKLT